MMIGYARNATWEGAIEPQLEALERAGCRTIYEDRGTKAAAVRAGLTQALEKAARGDTLVVVSLDRLARSTTHLIALFGDLEKRGLHLRAISDQIDTSSAGGVEVFRFMRALSRVETTLRKEAAHSQLIAKRARGRMGRPKKLSQADRDEAVRLYQAKQISPLEICRKFGISRRTLWVYLKDDHQILSKDSSSG